MRPQKPRFLRRLSGAIVGAAALLGATAIAASASPVYHDTSYWYNAPPVWWGYYDDANAPNCVDAPNCYDHWYDAPPVYINQGYYTYSPDNTSLPTISGQTRSTKTLTAGNGGWTNDAANGDPTNNYAYQWQSCAPDGTGCSNIAGAGASTYQLTTSEIGKTLRVKVTATNNSGSNTATSAASSVVTLNDTVAPTGTIASGASITSGAWQTGTTATLPVNAADSGLGVYRAFWRESGTTTYVSVDPANAQCQPLSSSAPYTFAPYSAGNVPCLTAAHDYTPTFDLAPMGDGIHTSVDLGIEDGAGNETILAANQTIKVNAPGLNPGPGNPGGLIDPGTPCTNGSYDDSGTCVTRPPSSTSLPLLSGTPAEGGSVSTDQGAWNDITGVTYTYAWELCDATGNSCSTIAGQNATSLAITRSMVDHTVRSIVTATTPDGQTSAHSAASWPIAATTPVGGAGGGLRDIVASVAAAGGGSGGRVELGDGVAVPVPDPIYTTASNGTGGDGTAKIDAWRTNTRALTTGASSAINGRLTTASGKPISSATIDVVAWTAVAGAKGAIVGTVKTNDSGEFSYTPKPGVSRIFTFGYRLTMADTKYVKYTSVALPVTTTVTLKANSQRLRTGQTLTLSGQVALAPTDSHKLVAIQTRTSGGWKTIATTRMRNGAFAYSHKFARTSSAVTYRFRALVVASSDWPMQAGASAERTVRVSPKGHAAAKKIKAAR